LALDISVTAVPASGSQPLRDHLAASAAAGEAVDVVAVGVPGTPPDAGDGTDGAGPGADGAGQGAAEIAAFLPAGTDDLLARHDASGAPGEVTEVTADLGSGLARVLLLGTGDGSPAAMRQAGAALGRRVKRGKNAVAAVALGAAPEATQAFAEALLLASYRFSLKSAAPGQAEVPPAAVALLVAGAARSAEPSVTASASPPNGTGAVQRAVTTAGAVALARDLVNTPSAAKSPEWLARQAAELAGRCGLRLRVHAGDELAAAGFGGILAVGSGSARPPRLIELSYQPEGWRTHVVLVGKGITFDSGGLSLKPAEGMKLMKTDMAGGAAVMAVMSVLAGLGARVRVTGLVAAAENMPSGSAMRPGDVISHFGGRTVEVLNTDAEGRLVLADALAYADATLAPDVLVDLATLTGAARIALGTKVGALFAADDDLAAALAAAGEASGERLWRMPIAGDYRDALDSQVADLANISTRDYGGAGAIVAALFLREFSGQRRWAHLDIAGPARAASDDGEVTKGGTGFGTRVLLRWLSGLS
jgi:leucyl aminopeptidase